MAKGRLLLASLGGSRKFRALGVGTLGEFAQALFPLIVANCDDAGMVEGDAVSVKCRIYNCSTRSEDDFEQAIAAMATVGLVTLSEEAGRRYITVAQFAKSQAGVKKKRPRSASPKAELSDDEWLTKLQAMPAFQHIQVRNLYAKMVLWCEDRREVPSRRRFLGWLNREPKPMTALATTNGRQPLPPKQQASFDALENWSPGERKQ